MNEVLLMAQLLFSEASKDAKFSDDDATSVAWVVKNRLARPERFGGTLEDVVYAPSQFSGVNSNEWNKVDSGNLTKEEEKIYKRFIQISSGVLRGDIKDTTGGADHYFNPKLANPSWAKKMKKTYSSGAHDYYSETGVPLQPKPLQGALTEIDSINEILNQNQNKNFVQRIISPDKFPTLDLGDNKFGTHKMSYSTTNNGAIVYPNIVQKNGKLVDLTKEGINPMEYAIQNKEFIKFDDKDKADWFSKNYKKVWEK